jgi:putative FmdB family regulatory protein
MPIYEYQCLQCEKKTELLQRMNDAPLAACPECGGEVRKLISAPAVQFKGSGWYVTDYANKKSGSSGKSESKSDSKSDGKPEGKSESSSSDSGGSSSEKSSPAEKTSSSDKGSSSGSTGSSGSSD